MCKPNKKYSKCTSDRAIKGLKKTQNLSEKNISREEEARASVKKALELAEFKRVGRFIMYTEKNKG